MSKDYPARLRDQEKIIVEIVRRAVQKSRSLWWAIRKMLAEEDRTNGNGKP